MKTLRVFIGMDDRQPVAYNVAQASIVRNSSRPVSITPLILSQLPLKRRGLTEFTFSRFLVPYLCCYEGHALFVDADILCLGDIAELPWDATESVSVVRHASVQKQGKSVDVRFERPSVMLFNCVECKRLTPDYIESGNPFSFDWANSIGSLPREWNYLVGYDNWQSWKEEAIPSLDELMENNLNHVPSVVEQRDKDLARISAKPKLAHFTQGIPIFEETANDEYAAEWLEMAKWCGESCSWTEIMGNSVHAKWKQKPAIASFLQLQGFG